MRYQVLVAAFSTLAAFSAGAQPSDTRASMEPVGSPFTYEALGATPSLRLQKRTQHAEAPAVITAETRSGKNADVKTSNDERVGAETAAENRVRAESDAKK